MIDPNAVAKRMNPDRPETVAGVAGREALNRVQVCIDEANPHRQFIKQGALLSSGALHSSSAAGKI